MGSRYRETDVKFFTILAKFVIGIVFFLASLIIIYAGLRPSLSLPREGEVALETKYAPFDFSYPSKVDEAKTALVRKRASESVLQVYDIVDSAIDEAQAAVERSEPIIRGAAGSEDVTAYKNKLHKLLALIYESLILDKESKKALASGKMGYIVARDPKSFLERTVKVDDILTREDIKKRFEKKLDEQLPKDAKLRNTLVEILKDSMKPNIVLNEAYTKEAEGAAADMVQPIYETQEVKKHEIIIQKGQRVTKAHVVMLKEMNRFMGRVTNGFHSTMGIALVLLVFIAIFYRYLRSSEPRIVNSLKYLTMTGALWLFLIALCKAAVLLAIPIRVVPFASVAMLLAILISSNTAMISVIMFAALCGLIVGGKMDIMLIFLVSGLVGIHAVRNVRSRFQIIVAGLGAGLAGAVVVVALGLANNLQFSMYLTDVMWSFANGVLSSFLVMGLLPVLEHLFKLSTNITLLELSDMSHPLLKELAVKAPGTYLHSHLVGNLAEAACEAIGANPLLARIGSYYHDIGKIEKAEYFSENETSFRSKHEKLRPSMSSLVIGNHVKEGVDLAKKYHLNKQIVDIIQQHHGTSLMYFFYKRALEDVNGAGPLKEQDYRYPGPKPQTKEAAVVLLADSVEASSRTLGEPTPGKIRNMVQRIINNKFIDNQLDECDLTLRDLYKISDAFVRVLIAAFHVRAEYPRKEEAKPSVNEIKDSESAQGLSAR